MPRASIHIKQAQLNEEAANKAAQSGYPDWAITMCFYAAIHYVEGYAKHHGDNIYEIYSNKLFTQHDRRQRYVDDIDDEKCRDNSLIAAYEKLSHGSKQARYLQSIPEPVTANKYFQVTYKEYFEALLIVKNFFVV